VRLEVRGEAFVGDGGNSRFSRVAGFAGLDCSFLGLGGGEGVIVTDVTVVVIAPFEGDDGALLGEAGACLGDEG